MRLFAALPLPPAAAERLLSLRLRLSDPRDGLRWSTPEQWHITLQFYGEVDDESERCLATSLEEFSAVATDIRMENLALFSAKGILVAAAVLQPGLQRLQEAVLRAGERSGFAAETRTFYPHVTLARSKGKTGHCTLKRLVSPQLPSLGPPLRWLATEYLLLSSTPQRGGAEYRVLRRFPLAAQSEPASGGQP